MAETRVELKSWAQASAHHILANCSLACREWRETGKCSKPGCLLSKHHTDANKPKKTK